MGIDINEEIYLVKQTCDTGTTTLQGFYICNKSLWEEHIAEINTEFNKMDAGSVARYYYDEDTWVEFANPQTYFSTFTITIISAFEMGIFRKHFGEYLFFGNTCMLAEDCFDQPIHIPLELETIELWPDEMNSWVVGTE